MLRRAGAARVHADHDVHAVTPRRQKGSAGRGRQPGAAAACLVWTSPCVCARVCRHVCRVAACLGVRTRHPATATPADACTPTPSLQTHTHRSRLRCWRRHTAASASWRGSSRGTGRCWHRCVSGRSPLREHAARALTSVGPVDGAAACSSALAHVCACRMGVTRRTQVTAMAQEQAVRAAAEGAAAAAAAAATEEAASAPGHNTQQLTQQPSAVQRQASERVV
jgi:hypothetical protein